MCGVREQWLFVTLTSAVSNNLIAVVNISAFIDSFYGWVGHNFGVPPINAGVVY